ncbi:MAG: hypothetical protein GPJ52_03915, partial [Candidatus Heimdallarchaeota archaeon]|nr:hypothetical protein [Candidatus Heimdallarchaeota archaeon]
MKNKLSSTIYGLIFTFLIVSSLTYLVTSSSLGKMRINDFSSIDNENQLATLTKENVSEKSLQPNAVTKSWTFMVYLDGDNDLEEAAISDIYEMERGGGTNVDINVVILVDRHGQYDTSNGDWFDGRYYEISDDVTTSIDSVLLSTLGEVNMGDPAILQAFLEYCFVNYPAEYYCLDLWDHGNGIWGACYDYTSPSNDRLTVNEMQSAISTATSNQGEYIDVISFDCCVMNMMEIVYELRNLCDYVVASEENIPFDGFDYEPIIAGLQTDPTLTPLEFSQLLVDEYGIRYASTAATCLSAIDTSKMGQLVPIMNNLVGNLTEAINDYDYYYMLYLSRSATRSFSDGAFMDLKDFALEINYYIHLENLVETTANLILALDELIAHNWQHESYQGAAHGIAIFMPITSYQLPIDACYDYANRTGTFAGMDWQAHTTWGEFLRTYYDYADLAPPTNPQMVSKGTETSTYLLDKDYHKEFIVNILTEGVYEFNMFLSSGDVNFDIGASFSQGIVIVGRSWLINPDDGMKETCRLLLTPNIYYIFIQGMAASSAFSILIDEYEIPTIELNTLEITGGGSSEGNPTTHYIQDLGHYYTINLNIDQFTFVLNNTATTDYQ